MREIQGNLFSFYGKPGYMVLITTNGFIRKDGCAVMGRGCALTAAQKFPKLPKMLGASLKKYGNVVKLFRPVPSGRADYNAPEKRILTFPVKHNWYEDADKALIRQSALALKKIAEFSPEIQYILPRPGCGNGHLEWEDVRPLLEDLPDNVVVVHHQPRRRNGH